MNYIKLTGFLMIVFSGIYITTEIISKTNRKIAFLKTLLSDIDFFRNEIVFLNSTVNEVVTKLSERDCGNSQIYKKILLLSDTGMSFGDAAEKVFSEYGGEKLTDGFLSMIGKTDAEGQQRVFDSAEIIVRKSLSEAEENKAKNLKINCVSVMLVFVVTGIILL